MEKGNAIRPAIWTALETKDFTIWDAYHDDLKRWYIDEGCSLKTVKSRMEIEHGFPATPLSQYEIVLRDHFHFRKNLEQSDWAFIAHHLRGRRHSGKDSDVYLDGKLLERQRIQRGIRRYGGKRVKRSHKMHQHNPVQSRIIIRTPSPEPISQIRNLGNISSLDILEKLLFSTRSFLNSSFESDAQPGSQSEYVAQRELHRKPVGWFNDSFLALELLQEKMIGPAFDILHQCFDNMSIIVQYQHHSILYYFYSQVLKCMEYDTGLAKILLRHCAALFQVFYGMSYPLYTIVDKLSQMDSLELANHIEPLIGSYLDILEPVWWNSPAGLGKLMTYRGEFLSLMQGNNMIGFEEARIMLDNLVRKAKDYGTCTIYLEMVKAGVLRRNGYLHEALSLALKGLDFQKHSYSGSAATRISLIRILREMGDYEGAIRTSYDLVESLSAPPGNEHNGRFYTSMIFLDQRQSMLPPILETLERDLRKSGRIEEAEAIQRRLEEVAHRTI